MSEIDTLSDAQKLAIRFATCSRAADAYFCVPDFIVRAPTLNTLIRKGYLSEGARYWLTEKGETARRSLLYETCQACGAETHKDEAACIACGALKSHTA